MQFCISCLIALPLTQLYQIICILIIWKFLEATIAKSEEKSLEHGVHLDQTLKQWTENTQQKSLPRIPSLITALHSFHHLAFLSLVRLYDQQDLLTAASTTSFKAKFSQHTPKYKKVASFCVLPGVHFQCIKIDLRIYIALFCRKNRFPSLLAERPNQSANPIAMLRWRPRRGYFSPSGFLFPNYVVNLIESGRELAFVCIK